jgi:hypothetical protein
VFGSEFSPAAFILYELQLYRLIGLEGRSVILYESGDSVDISVFCVGRVDVRRIQIKGYEMYVRGLLYHTIFILVKEARNLFLKSKIITNLALTLVDLREVAFARLAHNLRLVNRKKDV